jgi:outer membrane biogenesis lipoprotein LolB
MSVPHSRLLLLALLAFATLLFAGCSSAPPREPAIDPDVARAEIRARN